MAACVRGGTPAAVCHFHSRTQQTFTEPSLVLAKRQAPAGCCGSLGERGRHRLCPTGSSMPVGGTMKDEMSKQVSFPSSLPLLRRTGGRGWDRVTDGLLPGDAGTAL